MQIAPINVQIQKPSNPICPLVAKVHRTFASIVPWQKLKWKMRTFEIGREKEKAEKPRSLSSINAIVSVIRCFMIPHFNWEYTTHSYPTFGNGCIHCRSFFNCMTSSFARRRANCLLPLLFLLLLFHSVMSVNVFVWVFSSADECISNSMHLKMISKSHKWGNNDSGSGKWKVRYFHIVSLLFVRNHNHIMCETIDENYLLFEQFTVWPCISVSVQMPDGGCGAFCFII